MTKLLLLAAALLSANAAQANTYYGYLGFTTPNYWFRSSRPVFVSMIPGSRELGPELTAENLPSDQLQLMEACMKESATRAILVETVGTTDYLDGATLARVACVKAPVPNFYAQWRSASRDQGFRDEDEWTGEDGQPDDRIP